MEFQCSDPHAKIRAANVRSTFNAFKLVPALGHRLMDRHQLVLEGINPETMISLQPWLNVLQDIQAEVGAGTLRSVGANIVTNAIFPPKYSSVEAVLEGLDEIYHLNHTGEVGHYYVTQEEKGLYKVECRTPYPRHFERGLIEGICRSKGGASGQRYDIEYQDGVFGSDLSCTLMVRSL